MSMTIYKRPYAHQAITKRYESTERTKGNKIKYNEFMTPTHPERGSESFADSMKENG